MRGRWAGNSAGMNNLGWLYQMGFGITQDYAKAKEWYEKACNPWRRRGHE